MNRKKMLPLLAVAVAALVLALALFLLTVSQDQEEESGTPLCPFAAEEIDKLAYQGSNNDVTLLRGSEGNWMLDSDPVLPLDQTAVQAVVEDFAALAAQRCLRDDELDEIPERSDTPLMAFAIASGDETWSLTVDQANDVADIYYVYDGEGRAYTVAQADLSSICRDPRDLYAAQTLTELSADDVTALQAAGLDFVLTEDTWTLADDPDYPLDQSAVKKMVNTICNLQTAWSITTPEADAVYGLDSPDVSATLTFADGSTLTVRFGNTVEEDDTLCYLASSGTPAVVYEVDVDHKNAFAVTKATLYDEDATAETAQEGDVVAQYPVGGRDDYADSIE